MKLVEKFNQLTDSIEDVGTKVFNESIENYYCVSYVKENGPSQCILVKADTSEQAEEKFAKQNPGVKILGSRKELDPDEKINMRHMPILESLEDAKPIRAWYVEAFPEDSLGFELKEGITFTELQEIISAGKDVYDFLGVEDSIIRERCFDKLASLTGSSYDDIYEMWINNDESNTADDEFVDQVKAQLKDKEETKEESLNEVADPDYFKGGEEDITNNKLDTPRGTFNIYPGTWKQFKEDPEYKDWGMWFEHFLPEDADWKGVTEYYKIMSDGNHPIAVLFMKKEPGAQHGKITEKLEESLTEDNEDSIIFYEDPEPDVEFDFQIYEEDLGTTGVIIAGNKGYLPKGQTELVELVQGKDPEEALQALSAQTGKEYKYDKLSDYTGFVNYIYFPVNTPEAYLNQIGDIYCGNYKVFSSNDEQVEPSYILITDSEPNVKNYDKDSVTKFIAEQTREPEEKIKVKMFKGYKQVADYDESLNEALDSEDYFKSIGIYDEGNKKGAFCVVNEDGKVLDSVPNYVLKALVNEVSNGGSQVSPSGDDWYEIEFDGNCDWEEAQPHILRALIRNKIKGVFDLNESLEKDLNEAKSKPSSARLVWDDCTPTRDRRPTTEEDIEDDINVRDLSSEEELYELLLELANYEDEDLEMPDATIEEKIEAVLGSFMDPGDGSPNIFYAAANGHEFENVSPYDCLEDLDLATCTYDDIVDAIKSDYDFESDEESEDEDDNEDDNRRSLTNITISNGVKSIDDGAFEYYKNLTDVTIPNSVTTIGRYAFYYCSKLTSITFTGTKAQWNAIRKKPFWNFNTGDYTVHCTDGDVKKDMNESLKEDFKEVSVTTDDQHMEMTSEDNGKVTVTTEPVNNVEEQPVDVAFDATITTPDVEETEEDEETLEEDFSEDEFDSLDLPDVVTYKADELDIEDPEYDDIEFALSEKLSDDYGWLIKGFDYEEIKDKSGNVVKYICKNIDWDTDD